MTRATVIDADTVRVRGFGPVRLTGLDAPEIGQPATDARGRRYDAGTAAAKALTRHVTARMRAGWRMRVRGSGRDKYRRILGSIILEHPDGRTEDAGAWMVREGWAVAEYGDQHLDLEHEARTARRGIWAGRCERPRDYRRGKRAGTGTVRRRRSTGPGLLGMLSRLMRGFR